MKQGSITLIAIAVISLILGGSLVFWGTQTKPRIAHEPSFGAFDDPFLEIQGGTGTTTFVVGYILYSDGDDTLGSLSIGSADQVLTVSGGLPAWAAASGGETGSPGAWETHPNITNA